MTLQNGSLITGVELYDAGSLREQVLNYTDWGGLYTYPTSFAMFSKLGAMGTSPNSKITYNNTTGVKRIITAAANCIVAAPAASVSINLDTVSGETINDDYRVGDAFQINGYTSDTVTTKESAVVIIIDSDPAGGWICKTLWTSTAAGITFDFDSTAGDTLLSLTNSEDYNGAAPEAISIAPTQGYNWMQLYRQPYGVTNTAESSDKLFGNMRSITSKEAESRLFGSLNHDILFSNTTLKPKGDESGGASGTGGGFGMMGGLPYLLGASALQNSTAKYHAFAAEFSPTTAAHGAAIIGAYYDFCDKFNDSGKSLLFVTSSSMRKLLRQAVTLTGTTMYTGEYILPDATKIYFEEINFGNMSLKFVVDGALGNENAPYITNGTTYASKNFFGYALNMEHVGISYRNRKDYGIMAPKDFVIDQIRNKYQFESEWVAECTLGMVNQHEHGILYFNA